MGCQPTIQKKTQLAFGKLASRVWILKHSKCDFYTKKQTKDVHRYTHIVKLLLFWNAFIFKSSIQRYLLGAANMSRLGLIIFSLLSNCEWNSCQQLSLGFSFKCFIFFKKKTNRKKMKFVSSKQKMISSSHLDEWTYRQMVGSKIIFQYLSFIFLILRRENSLKSTVISRHNVFIFK